MCLSTCPPDVPGFFCLPPQFWPPNTETFAISSFCSDSVFPFPHPGGVRKTAEDNRGEQRELSCSPRCLCQSCSPKPLLRSQSCKKRLRPGKRAFSSEILSHRSQTKGLPDAIPLHSCAWCENQLKPRNPQPICLRLFEGLQTTRCRKG